jgi:hypothetical protein
MAEPCREDCKIIAIPIPEGLRSANDIHERPENFYFGTRLERFEIISGQLHPSYGMPAGFQGSGSLGKARVHHESLIVVARGRKRLGKANSKTGN